MLKWLVQKLLRPKWVVFESDDAPELGLKIWGVTVALYKGEVYYPDTRSFRAPEKREFGESLHPQ